MATCTQDVFVGNIGTIFRATIKECLSGVDSIVDIGSASALAFTFEKPDGTTLTKTATLSSDGSDGKMQYTTISGDLDQSGVWRVQAKVVMGGNEYYSTIDSFDVEANI